MLNNTFIHISGVGRKTEKQIWQTGIHSWQEFRPEKAANLRPALRQLISSHLSAQRADILASPDYFYKRLASNEQWRLFPHFRDQTAYLDIETNGARREQCSITTIALYDGREIFTFVQGDNLQDFPEHLKRYKVIVTYNGKSFDAPILEQHFSMKIDQAHLDLRPILAALGYKGGLKGCERQLGVERHDLAGISGRDAITLWNHYQQTDREAFLDTLLAYNIADTVNLESLMVQAYNLHIATTPFRLSNYIATPEPQTIPFAADPLIVQELRARQSYR